MKKISAELEMTRIGTGLFWFLVQLVFLAYLLTRIFPEVHMALMFVAVFAVALAYVAWKIIQEKNELLAEENQVEKEDYRAKVKHNFELMESDLTKLQKEVGSKTKLNTVLQNRVSELDKELSSKTNEVSELKTEVSVLKSKVSSKTNEVSVLEKQVSVLKTEVSKNEKVVSETHNEVSLQLDTLQTKLAQKQTKLAHLETELGKKISQLARFEKANLAQKAQISDFQNQLKDWESRGQAIQAKEDKAELKKLGTSLAQYRSKENQEGIKQRTLEIQSILEKYSQEEMKQYDFFEWTYEFKKELQ